MVNIKQAKAPPPLDEGARRFIDEIASLLTPWGMAGSSARAYGYILLNQEPVSLDQIAASLQMSRVGAWKAARALEDFGHVRRYGEPGSKRVRYGPTDSFEVPMLKQCALLGSLGQLMQSSANGVTEGEASTRLQQMSRFYLAMRQAMEGVVSDFNVERAAVNSKAAAKISKRQR